MICRDFCFLLILNRIIGPCLKDGICYRQYNGAFKHPGKSPCSHTTHNSQEKDQYG